MNSVGNFNVISRRSFLKGFAALLGTAGASSAQVIQSPITPNQGLASQGGSFYSNQLNLVMGDALGKTNTKLRQFAVNDEKVPVKEIIDILNVRILNNVDIAKDLKSFDRKYSNEAAYREFKQDFNASKLAAQKASLAFNTMQTTRKIADYKLAAKTLFDNLSTIEKDSALDAEDSILNKLAPKLYVEAVIDKRLGSTIKSIDIEHRSYEEWVTVLTNHDKYLNGVIDF